MTPRERKKLIESLNHIAEVYKHTNGSRDNIYKTCSKAASVIAEQGAKLDFREQRMKKVPKGYEITDHMPLRLY